VNAPVIRFRGVTRRFAGDPGVPPALSRLSVAIAPGEFVAVTGPSGSGKSTFLNLAAGLDVPDAGSVHLAGHVLGDCTDAERTQLRLRHVGIVFQHFNLLPRLSALDNVALPLMYAGVPRRQRLERAAAGLERVGLAHRASAYPAQLSGGEQQRIAIARALVNEPAVLFADEPTGSLDTATGHRVLEILEGLNARGTTVVLVTHDPEVARLGSRRLGFVDGRLREDSSCARLRVIRAAVPP
jgi:putative ABC transport system ATP-binding protein